MKIDKVIISILILTIIYVVGIVGLSIPTFRADFLHLTPLNLLLTITIFIWLNNDYSSKFLILSLIIFSIGFGVEVIGVATGALFGSYSYGETLGFKIFDVPLLIGINWLLLAYATFGIASKFFQNKYLVAALAALLMTGLDVLIEPVAIQLDFWTWAHEGIPLQNYLMWFITAFLIHNIIVFFKITIKPNISYAIVGLQILFFSVLAILL